MRIELKKTLQALRKKEYIIFEDPYELNIIGIRSADMTPNIFNDKLVVFWMTEDITEPFEIRDWNITTDPGLYWLKNPSNINGTAILFPGQYDVYSIDKHKGKYDALCQRRGPVKVYRDKNKNSRYDAAFTEEGDFGINIHKAGIDSITIDKWSAGCQVFQREEDFNEFITFCKRHRAIHGNNFVYTLIKDIDLINPEVRGGNG